MSLLVFDSGIGGLTVLREARVLMPHRRFVYVADDAGFPYGDWAEDGLRAHILKLFTGLIETHRPDLVIVACNTASTLVLADLRKAFPDTPFVGTVPAIKPAAAQTKSGIVGVLATPGTVSREYTHALIHTYAYHCKVFLHGARRLAEIAENKLKGKPVDLEELRREVAPVFRKRDGRRTDVVVLGCTHYPLLVEDIERVAPWPATYIDPAPAIARRVADVAEETPQAEPTRDVPAHGTVLLTSLRGQAADSLSAYAAMGFPLAEFIDMAV